MPENPPQTPTAAALLYLFADRVVEPDSAISKGFKVPCTETSVKRVRVAGDAFAITFWNLQEQGKIELSMGKRTLLGAGRPQITAAMRPGQTVKSPPQGATMGIDPAQLAQLGNLKNLVGGQIEQALAAAQQYAPILDQAEVSSSFTLEDAVMYQLSQVPSAPVRDVIRDWFLSDYSDPQGHVLARVAKEVADLGLVTGFNPGGFFGTPEPVIDCTKRSALEAGAVELLERWRVFRDTPDGLGPTLADRSKAAIGSRTEGDDSD